MAAVVEMLQCFDMSQKFYPNVIYNAVELADFYRKERPYRLLCHPGVSSVTMSFGLSRAADVSDIIVELNHCGTTSLGKIDIIVNGSTVRNNLSTPRDDFSKEVYEFSGSSFSPEDNNITIQLNSDSPGVYWLSDALISIRRRCDSPEKAIEEQGRDIFVNLRKLESGRMRLIEHLRKVADELDLLHTSATTVKATGEGAKIGGYLLMLGGAALEVLSEGIATPIVAEMEAAGWSLVVGGSAVEMGAEIWDEIRKKTHAKEAEELIKDDQISMKVIADNNKELGDLFKCSMGQEKSSASIDPMIAIRNAFLASYVMPSVLNSSEISKEGAVSLKITNAISLASFARTFSLLLSAVDAGLTFQQLMKHVAELSEGKPSVMGQRLRQVANDLEDGLQTIRKFQEDTLGVILKQLKHDLDESNLRSVARIFMLMPLFDGIEFNGDSFHMSWLNNWQKVDNLLSEEQRNNLANALNQIYQEMKHTLRKKGSGQVIDLVIVAHGSIGRPTDQMALNLPILTEEVLTPSSLFFSARNLTSVTFYQPWGVLISAQANYAIITGTIQPNQTRLVGIGTQQSFPNTLPTFNHLNAQSNVMIPHTWCNPINDNDPALNELLQYIAQGNLEGLPHRPFIWWRLGSIPSYFLSSMAGLAALVMQEDVRIHYGMCLNWPSTTEPPPEPLLGLHQYYNALGETFRQPFYLTIA